MQYLRNIIFLIIIFVFNAEYANAQVNRDEIRVGQDKILTNSYDDIIVNAKDYTLQNIDKVQNIVTQLYSISSSYHLIHTMIQMKKNTV